MADDPRGILIQESDKNSSKKPFRINAVVRQVDEGRMDVDNPTTSMLSRN